MMNKIQIKLYNDQPLLPLLLLSSNGISEFSSFVQMFLHMQLTILSTIYFFILYSHKIHFNHHYQSFFFIWKMCHILMKEREREKKD